MKKYRLYFFIPFLIPNYSFSNELITNKLNFLTPYYHNLNIDINSQNIKTNKQMQEVLEGKEFYIPRDWRLVNVIQNQKMEFVMFFQAEKGDVFSIKLDAGGNLTGNEMIHIPVKK